ncbi:hypothetical protein [Nannocystis punicea]|uniref:Uncharacterized protein n=1 Tax=Nannocystis punicea TaxID=2995304 RepID=A0ABY7HDB2_9BACT|nr:hypothetical protein [Nannocystis poenicansa]WAS97283.1 hypothetical protein O0S08_14135 [Nannocystis poenicansa]
MRAGARALAAAVVCAMLPDGAAARTTPPEEREMVRPDREGEPRRVVPTPMVAVTPPDLLPPVIPEQKWRAERRKVKIQAAASWTVALIGLVGMAVPLVILGTCGDEQKGSYVRWCPERRGAQIAAPIFAAVALAGLVPAVIYTDRLLYQRIPARAPQLGLGPGGLLLRF